MVETIKISVIVSTYNWPKALDLVLMALKNQSDPNFEVIVADDGSTESTREVLSKHQKSFFVKLVHAWQEDLGFRLAAVRNLAIKHSSGDYLVFLDGDCIVRPSFIANHRKLAEKGFFVTGTRILLNKEFSQEILENSENIGSLPLGKHLINKLQGKANKFLPLIGFPVLRKLFPYKWQCLRGCNFAAWKSDIEKVNGFDESFQGWGYEDSDFAIRMINSGIKRKSGKFSVPVFHLWHKVGNKEEAKGNWNLLMQRIASKKTKAQKGLIGLNES